MRLLLVENDEMIAETLLAALRRMSYTADWAKRACEKEIARYRSVYDLIIFDLDTQRSNGITAQDWCDDQSDGAPVIFLTALETADDSADEGCPHSNNQLVGSFDLEKLATRVRTLLRHRAGTDPSIWVHGELKLDPVARVVTQSGVALSLTPFEFAILQALMEDPEHVFRSSELEKRSNCIEGRTEIHAVETSLDGLRRKIGASEIVAVRGVGYRLRRLA
ncbi:DNA-binding response regulator [Burkholderia sp. SFA1]|uniref:winged helix-turn-helix domain-containing protein n=1 Tax=unclassified Caballeronia TaxID=2646786 RepID=UPI001F3CE5AB|nr:MULTISPECIES: response regulator transcription factor [unclassified Caballeronia]MCE4544864.1 response regulator transcription factor [Caballeronia sp. PC1]MCE4570289.1 response regulator transcription factor [Caballeronia sp. CLC5]BBP98127.1 DNA-binding response regulator [Burkholderia sp. SFA1]